MNILATGLGLVSPLGHTAPASCAAIRAGLSNFVELDSTVDRDGAPVIASVLEPSSLVEDPLGPAIMACREAIAACRMPLQSEEITISILSSEKSRTRRELIEEADVEQLARTLGFRHWHVAFYRDGNAAGFRAMRDIQDRIERNARSVELVLGADSLVTLPTLAYLEKVERLKGNAFPRGLVPGEACGCVVFQESNQAHIQQGHCYMSVASAYTTEERATIDSSSPCLGDGLTKAIQGAMDRARWTAAEVGQVYCDLNGESYRAHEWMLALCRCLDDPSVAHPADCVADIGAAFGPLLLCQAATAMQKGYSRGDRAIAFCSSDGGLRGCVCVEPYRT